MSIPPPLPTESSAYTMNIPCIYFSIPNNGERIVLPSLVSRVAKDNAVMKEDKDSRKEIDSYQKKIDEINSTYTAQSIEVISEEGSVNSYVADFKTPLSR